MSSNIKILDCTLRDGGYINDWHFGKTPIKRIINKLSNSNIDIIECGFLRDLPYNKDKSIFNDVEQIKTLITKKDTNKIYVAMIALGDIDPKKIAPCDGTSLDGIRITFHKDDWGKEKEAVKILMKKGYKVFVQPVGTTTYTDKELIELIDKVNDLNPYAFYLVDTLGVMYNNELLRLFSLADRNLNKDIAIGFHSHNNLQLAFSNAQALVLLQTKRNIIIDSSVFGMGRGAGNLCTELIAEYINDNVRKKYDIIPLLEIVDNFLSPIFGQASWGYSVAYFLAAIHNCHPNYATYLLNRSTMTVKEINKILKSLKEDKRNLYDKDYIADLYIKHQSHSVDDINSRIQLKKKLIDNNILVLAPGITLRSEKDKIKRYIEKYHPKIISVNFVNEEYNADIVFVSNLKRFKNICDLPQDKIIITSNIKNEVTGNSISIIDYASLLNETKEIEDNAGLMLLNLLTDLDIKNVAIAGMDGFHIDPVKNYFSKEYSNVKEHNMVLNINNLIKNEIDKVKKKINVNMITTSLYE